MKKKISLITFFGILTLSLIFIIFSQINKKDSESTVSTPTDVITPANITTEQSTIQKMPEKISEKNNQIDSTSVTRKRNLTNEIIQLDEMEDAFLETEKQMAMALAAVKNRTKSSKKLTEKQQQKAEQFLENIFSDGAEMLSAFQEKLNSDFSEEELIELKDILSNPILKKISEAKKNLSPEDLTALYKDAQQNKMNEDRSTILNEYIEEANIMEQSVNMATNINYASVVAQKGTQGPDVATKTFNAIHDAIEKQSDTIKKAIKTGIYVETKVLSDKELKVVVDLNKQAIMKKYNNAILKSMESSIISNDGAIEDLGSSD